MCVSIYIIYDDIICNYFAKFYDVLTFSVQQHTQLHYACANGTEIEVVKILLDAYPDSKLTTVSEKCFLI